MVSLPTKAVAPNKAARKEAREPQSSLTRGEEKQEDLVFKAVDNELHPFFDIPSKFKIWTWLGARKGRSRGAGGLKGS